MTLPAFKAAGTGSETAPAWPTHVAGDFGLLVFEANNGTNIADPPSGWTAIPLSPSISTNASRVYVCYRVATSSSESAPSLTTGVVDHVWGVILTFTDVNTITPYHEVTTGSNIGATTTPRCPGLTTLIDDCMIVNIAAWASDNAGPLWSGETNASLANLAERYDAGTVTGNGGGIAVITGEKATKGDVLGTTGTWSVSATMSAMTIALQGSQKSIGKKNRIVNVGM